METKRFVEHFLCDAIRLAQILGEGQAKLSEGLGNADDFPLNPRERDQVGNDVRFIRVNGKEYYEVAFVTEDNPTIDDIKLRNKSVYRVMFGSALKKARLSVGMSLEELARKTNLREHSLQRIEEGRWDFDTTVMGNILSALGKSFKIV